MRTYAAYLEEAEVEAEAEGEYEDGDEYRAAARRLGEIPADHVGVLLLRREVRRRIDIDSSSAAVGYVNDVLGVGAALDALERQAGLAGARGDKIEGLFAPVFALMDPTVSGVQPVQGRGRGQTRRGELAWWAFDEALQDASWRLQLGNTGGGSDEDGFHSEFDALLAEKASKAAVVAVAAAERVERVAAVSVGEGTEITRLVQEMELNLSVRDVMRVVQREVERAVVLEEAEEETSRRGVLPCLYCSGSEVFGKPWTMPLMWTFGFTDEQVEWTSEDDLISIVRGRGGVSVDPVAGLEILVDGTGGETRVVLVGMGSVFDDIMMLEEEDEEEEEGESIDNLVRQPLGVREDWDGGVLTGRHTI